MIHQTKNKPCVCKILPWHSLPCPPFGLLNAMTEGAYTSNEKGSPPFLFPHTDYCVRTWVPKSRTPSVWFLMFIWFAYTQSFPAHFLNPKFRYCLRYTFKSYLQPTSFVVKKDSRPTFRDAEMSMRASHIVSPSINESDCLLQRASSISLMKALQYIVNFAFSRVFNCMTTSRDKTTCLVQVIIYVRQIKE